mmetsp:Transcript_20016/g.36303  ORF Transcript_20016/g.36303 Transcript_20016/m.36303 type:complete len:301 (+) Transcript_20016:177-1079(+)
MERRNIRKRSVAAHLIRPMRVKREKLQSSLLCHVLTPALCPSKKESLSWRKAINHWPGIKAFLCLESTIGKVQTTKVCDVFATSKLSLYRLTMHLEGIGLIYHHLDATFILLGILFSPPVKHVALKIKFPSLVIKPMRHLVANHCTHRSIVYGIVCFSIKERRLENGGRKHNLVKTGMVVGVYGLRSQEPLFAIGGGIHFFHLACMLKCSRLENHFQEAIGILNVQSCVIDPFVGIPNLDFESCHFLQTCLSSCLSHPLYFLEPFLESCTNVFHNLKCATLAFFVKVFCTVQLTKCFSKS